MHSYLVETYAPRSRPRTARSTERRLRASAEQLEREGIRIRYVRATFLPDDDTCFHLVHASAPTAVDALCDRAGLPHARVVRAVEMA
jgi:hypothetical protein